MTTRSIAVAAALVVASGVAWAKLPTPTLTDAQKAAAAEAAAKSAAARRRTDRQHRARPDFFCFFAPAPLSSPNNQELSDGKIGKTLFGY